jgi:hypothetical protein
MVFNSALFVKPFSTVNSTSTPSYMQLLVLYTRLQPIVMYKYRNLQSTVRVLEKIYLSKTHLEAQQQLEQPLLFECI